jgi:hypothetical protein
MLNAAGAVNLAAGVTGALATISVPATPGIGEDVTLDSTGSASSVGALIANYEWTVTQGAQDVTVVGNASGPTATTLTLHTVAAGTVSVKLVVTDSLGKVGVSFRTFTTTAPTAVITGTAQLTPQGTIQLSGSGSTGGGMHQITTWQWSVVGGGANVVTLAAPTNTNTVTVTGGTPGSAVVQLTVTDDAGQSATTTTTLTVAAPPSSGGGGGAANPAWLLALALAGLVLAPRRERAKR